MIKKNFIDPNFLINTSIPENVYLLGLIWADGNLSRRRYPMVSLQTNIDDFATFEPLFRGFGIVTFYNKQNYVNGKIFGRQTRTGQFYNKKINNFLIANDFWIKSTAAPNKILAVIPNSLHYMFWRGYFDGDGCLYANTRTELAFWSTESQDWQAMNKLFSDLGIEGSKLLFYSRKNGKHRSSCFCVRKGREIKKFLDYIYQEYADKPIGLKRKYDRYLQLVEKVSKFRIKTSKHRGVCFNNGNGKWKATACVDGKKIHLGWFKTEGEAIKKVDNHFERLGIKNETVFDSSSIFYVS